MPRTTTKQGPIPVGHRASRPESGSAVCLPAHGYADLGVVRQGQRRPVDAVLFGRWVTLDRERGKLEAEDRAEQLRRKGGIRTGDIVTLGALFELYEREVVPTKGTSAQEHNRRALPLFLRLWGAQREVASLSIREWRAYIGARRSGKLAPGRQWKAGAQSHHRTGLVATDGDPELGDGRHG